MAWPGRVEMSLDEENLCRKAGVDASGKNNGARLWRTHIGRLLHTILWLFIRFREQEHQGSYLIFTDTLLMGIIIIILQMWKLKLRLNYIRRMSVVSNKTGTKIQISKLRPTADKQINKLPQTSQTWARTLSYSLLCCWHLEQYLALEWKKLLNASNLSLLTLWLNIILACTGSQHTNSSSKAESFNQEQLFDFSFLAPCTSWISSIIGNFLFQKALRTGLIIGLFTVKLGWPVRWWWIGWVSV